MSVVLNALNEMDSLLWASTQNLTQDFFYSPYGSTAVRDKNDALTGFNGERLDPISQVYHLGNGYRNYNPSLMRFNAPDSWSPFGAGGPNPYVYCEGDPINRADPGGHMSWQVGLDLGLGILSLVSTVLTAGLSVAAAGGMMAALSGAEAVDLVAGGLGVAADLTGISSAAIEESDPEASDVLGWLSFALGVASLGTHTADFAHAKLSHAHGSYDLSHDGDGDALAAAGKWANTGSETIAFTDTAYTLVDMTEYPPKLNSTLSGSSQAEKTSRGLASGISIQSSGPTGQLNQDSIGTMNSESMHLSAGSSGYQGGGIDSPTVCLKKRRLRSMRDRFLRSKPIVRKQRVKCWDGACDGFKMRARHDRVGLDGLPALTEHAKPKRGWIWTKRRQHWF